MLLPGLLLLLLARSALGKSPGSSVWLHLHRTTTERGHHIFLGITLLVLNAAGTQRRHGTCCCGILINNRATHALARCVLVHSLEREADPLAGRVNADNFEVYHVAFLDHVARVRYTAFGKLGYMDEALNAVLQPGKSAEAGKLGDRAAHELAQLVVIGNGGPRLGLRALERESYLPLVRVYRQHVHVDAVSHLQHFAGVRYTLPRKLRKVDEAVGPADVYKRAEIANRGNSTGANLARLKLAKQP